MSRGDVIKGGCHIQQGCQKNAVNRRSKLLNDINVCNSHCYQIHNEEGGYRFAISVASSNVES